MPVQSWIVFFRVLDQHHVVRVLRVRHGARRRLKRYE
jgi:plasmid stabilization system protein ParE